ncbi:hypothetical protein STEG23_033952, partial [Scotinomys teguina]
MPNVLSNLQLLAPNLQIMDVLPVCMSDAFGKQKMVLDLLKLELQMVVISHMEMSSHIVAQAGFLLNNPPVSTSQVLGLQAALERTWVSDSHVTTTTTIITTITTTTTTTTTIIITTITTTTTTIIITTSPLPPPSSPSPPPTTTIINITITITTITTTTTIITTITTTTTTIITITTTTTITTITTTTTIITTITTTTTTIITITTTNHHHHQHHHYHHHYEQQQQQQQHGEQIGRLTLNPAPSRISAFQLAECFSVLLLVLVLDLTLSAGIKSVHHHCPALLYYYERMKDKVSEQGMSPGLVHT